MAEFFCEADNDDSIIVADSLDKDEELSVIIHTEKIALDVYLSKANVRHLANHLLKLLEESK